MFNAFHAFMNSFEISSTNSFGFLPAFFAASSTFFPCSSVPVTNRTSLPWSLFHLARTSATIFWYACPICGAAFT